MKSQEMELLEAQDIDLVELGAISELVQENAPRPQQEYAVSPGYWWLPVAIYKGETE